MKRFAYILLMAVLISSFAFAKPAAAAGTWTTGIDVQNLEGADGSVTVKFFTDTGADAGSLTRSILAWGGLNFYLPSETSPAAGATYSAVIESTVRVAATVGLSDYTDGGADLYLGTEAPENTINFPLVYHKTTSGWNSTLTVQNASGAAQNVVLKLYTAGSATAAYTSPSTPIPAYASVTFNMADSTYNAFGTSGSATVTGSAPLAGVAKNTRDTGAGPSTYITTMYRAFGSTQVGKDIVAPLVYKNYNSFTSGVNILNLGASATHVTITYTNANPNITGATQTWTDSLDLAANAMGVFYTPANATGLPNNFFGSIALHSDTNNIAVVVSSQRYLASGGQGMAYEGAVTTAPTPCVSLPVVHNRTTWKTGINVLNLGDLDTTITINYYSTVAGKNGGTKTYDIAAHKPLTIYMPADAVTDVGFAGAADIRSNNAQNLLVLATHSNSGGGVASNFVGINYTCP